MLSVTQAIPKSLIITFILGVLVICEPAIPEARPKATAEIAASTLNVRSKPDANSRIIKVLNRGMRADVLEEEEDWLKISHRGEVGYVRYREKYVRILLEDTSSQVASMVGEIDSIADGNLGNVQIRAEDIHQEIESSRAEVLAFTEREAGIIENLNRLDRSLNVARKQHKRLRKGLADLAVSMDGIQQRANSLNRKIRVSEEHASKRIVALYKLSWIGKARIVASGESAYDILNRQQALERILAADEKALQELWQDKMQLKSLISERSEQLREKRRLEHRMNGQVASLTEKREDRAAILARIQTRKSLKLAAIDALNKAALALDEKMKSLSLAAEAPIIIEEVPLQEPVPRKQFSLLKGLLKLPVKGKIISSFGVFTDEEYHVKRYRSGINIKADRGEPIRAVSGGTVKFANWFKGYGNMIIIDHGEHYYTVYAHIEELFKSENDSVESGEVVATVGDTGSQGGSKLYFEIRHHGTPVDPLSWIDKG